MVTFKKTALTPDKKAEHLVHERHSCVTILTSYKLWLNGEGEGAATARTKDAPVFTVTGARMCSVVSYFYRTAWNADAVYR